MIANIRAIGTNEGLAFREIFYGYQDNRGYLWLATMYGLVKYDGYNFTYFNKEKDGLSSNNVKKILEDKNGFLWVLTTWAPINVGVLNLSFFDLHKEKIISIEKRFGSSFPVKLNQIISIYTTPTHAINILTSDLYVYSYDEKKDSFIKTDKSGILDMEIVTSPLGYTSEQTALENALDWFHSEDKSTFDLLKLPKNQSEYYLSNIEENKANEKIPLKVRKNESFKDKHVQILHQYEDSSYIFIDSESDTWFMRLYADGKIVPIGHPVTKSHRHNGIYRSVYQKELDVVWYANREQFIVYDPATNTFLDLRNEYPNLIGNRVIHHISFGKDGTTWIATDDGIIAIELKTNPFTHFLYNDGIVFNLSEKSSCRGIYKVEDQLLIGHNNKTSVFNLADPTVPPHHFDFFAYAFQYPYINKNNLLIYAPPFVINWDMANNSFRPKENDMEPFGKNHGVDLFSYSDSSSLVATYNGVVLLEHNINGIDSTKDFKEWNKYGELETSKIYQFTPIQNGHVLLTTASGLYEMSFEKGLINRYWEGGTGRHYLPFKEMIYLKEDTNNSYWIATRGEGLIHWNKTNGDFQQIIQKDGLPSDILYAVYKDEQNTLWMPTYNGLVAYDPENGSFNVFKEEDGITHNEFNTHSHFKDEKGRMYFGGLNGVNAFYPSEVKRNKNISYPMHVIHIAQYDMNIEEHVDKTALYTADSTIRILPKHGYTTLSLSLMDLKNSTDIHYEYKLGATNPWRNINGHELELSGLPYGDHQLLLRGQSPRNGSLLQTIKMQVQVVRPFYLRWWFYISAIAFAAGCIYLFIKNKTRRLARQKKEMEDLAELRAIKILEQQQALEEDQKLIKKQAAEIKKLGQVIQMSNLSSADAEWLKKLESTIANKMGDPTFRAQELATAMHLSRAQFHRKLKAVTQLTPGAWLQETRLQKAKELLENKEYDSIKAVALEVGIKPNYFAEAFKKRFKVLPTDI